MSADSPLFYPTRAIGGKPTRARAELVAEAGGTRPAPHKAHVFILLIAHAFILLISLRESRQLEAYIYTYFLYIYIYAYGHMLSTHLYLS